MMPVGPLFKRPLVRLEMVRLVVEAVPKYPVPETLSAVDDAYGNWLAATVELEKNTPWVQIEVVVAAVVVPKFAAVVNGYAKVPVLRSAAQEKAPLDHVR